MWKERRKKRKEKKRKEKKRKEREKERNEKKRKKKRNCIGLVFQILQQLPYISNALNEFFF